MRIPFSEAESSSQVVVAVIVVVVVVVVIVVAAAVVCGLEEDLAMGKCWWKRRKQGRPL